jgi:hypothetical protein
MTNKHIMIFQTAVRKYVDMQEKGNFAIWFAFIHRFPKNNQKKFWTKNAENFHNALIFLENFTNSK